MWTTYKPFCQTPRKMEPNTSYSFACQKNIGGKSNMMGTHIEWNTMFDRCTLYYTIQTIHTIPHYTTLYTLYTLHHTIHTIYTLYSVFTVFIRGERKILDCCDWRLSISSTRTARQIEKSKALDWRQVLSAWWFHIAAKHASTSIGKCTGRSARSSGPNDVLTELPIIVQCASKLHYQTSCIFAAV